MSESVRIMVSSTRADLFQYRQRAQEIIAKLKAEQQGKWEIIEVSMEAEVQSGKREYPVAVSKKWVEESDWVVVIVGWHYGTITDEDGAAGFGVTEWEYRHAMGQKKSVFVFLSGDADTLNEYKALESERNLLMWAIRQSDDQRKKLEQFRQEVGTRHGEYFKNIDHFVQQLEKTLRRAIDDLIPAVPPGSQLAMLILEVKPAFVACMSSIKSLNCCKAVHDALHELRQEVIRPIRGRVLSLWAADGKLSRTNERDLNDIRVKAGRLLSKIASSCTSLDETKAVNLLEDVTRLATRESLLNPFPNAAADDEPDLDAFTEGIDQFSAAAQTAFSRANDDMQEEQRAFDELHAALLERLQDARGNRRLRPEEDRTLTEEIRKLSVNKVRLVRALAVHANWQFLHDAMESLQEFRGTKTYERRLREFVDQNGNRLNRLVIQTPESLDIDVDLDTVLQAGLLSLKNKLPMSANIDSDGFDEIRSAFDDCFFQVDKRALAVVDRSRGRVKQLEALFDQLAQTPASPAAALVDRNFQL